MVVEVMTLVVEMMTTKDVMIINCDDDDSDEDSSDDNDSNDNDSDDYDSDDNDCID